MPPLVDLSCRRARRARRRGQSFGFDRLAHVWYVVILDRLHEFIEKESHVPCLRLLTCHVVAHAAHEGEDNRSDSIDSRMCGMLSYSIDFMSSSRRNRTYHASAC